MATSQWLMTAEELLRLPDDGQRHELIAGALTTMPPSGAEHGRVAVRITGPLSHYVATHGLGEVYAAETGFLLARDPDTVRAPDVAFVSRERVAAAGTVTGYWPGAPDLAVEVISPNDEAEDLEGKLRDYRRAGVRLIWVVYPVLRAARVCRADKSGLDLDEADELDGEDVLPGFRCRLGDLFPPRPAG